MARVWRRQSDAAHQGFTGKERDPETGLDYFGARYDMSALGRWGAADPSADASPEWSPYNYAIDNPSGVVDPDGRVPVCLAGPVAISVRAFAANVAGGAIGGALGQVAANWSEGRGLLEGVGTAFLEGARERATWGLFGAGLGVVEDVAVQRAVGTTRVVADATAASPVIPGGDAAQGEFSVSDWSGYPEYLPKPQAPFRIVEGSEYSTARKAANVENRAMHRADPSLAGKHIHEIKPVKFGGSPTAAENKVVLTPPEHASVTAWWQKLLADLKGQGK